MAGERIEAGGGVAGGGGAAVEQVGGEVAVAAGEISGGQQGGDGVDEYAVIVPVAEVILHVLEVFERFGGKTDSGVLGELERVAEALAGLAEFVQVDAVLAGVGGGVAVGQVLVGSGGEIGQAVECTCAHTSGQGGLAAGEGLGDGLGRRHSAVKLGQRLGTEFLANGVLAAGEVVVQPAGGGGCVACVLKVGLEAGAQDVQITVATQPPADTAYGLTHPFDGLRRGGRAE